MAGKGRAVLCPVCREPMRREGFTESWAVEPGKEGCQLIPRYRCNGCNVAESPFSGELVLTYDDIPSLAKIEGHIGEAS